MTTIQFSRTAFTGHLKPTRESSKGIVLTWADDYHAAEIRADHLEDLDQYVRRLSVELHADVRLKDFETVLEALTEVRDVEDGNHEALQVNQLGTVNNKAELLDATRQELAACINHLLTHAGFGISARSVAA